MSQNSTMLSWVKISSVFICRFWSIIFLRPKFENSRSNFLRWSYPTLEWFSACCHSIFFRRRMQTLCLWDSLQSIADLTATLPLPGRICMHAWTTLSEATSGSHFDLLGAELPRTTWSLISPREIAAAVGPTTDPCIHVDFFFLATSYRYFIESYFTIPV